MAENRQLMAIANNMPDYKKCRESFFEHYEMFNKLGPANYAALGQPTGLFQGPADEVIGVFLAGMALGRAQELSERGFGEYWSSLLAWTLVEDELAVIRQDIPRLPAPAEIEVKIPPQKRRRA